MIIVPDEGFVISIDENTELTDDPEKVNTAGSKLSSREMAPMFSNSEAVTGMLIGPAIAFNTLPAFVTGAFCPKDSCVRKNKNPIKNIYFLFIVEMFL
jgi:hypothetical protein